MDLINDIELLNKLIQNYFVRNTITNNYLLSSAYSQHIENRRLFYITKATNAYILVKKSDFYQLYYYVNNQSELMTFNVEEPIIMEILYRGEVQRPKGIITYWEECGFRQHITRDTMMALYDQIVLPSDYDPSIEIQYAETDKEISFSKELIETTFDKYTGDILTFDEVKSFVKNRNIICAYLEGNLCGILQFEIKNNVVWLGHIAVSPEFRGLGIANALVKAYIVNNAALPTTKYQLWVIQGNIKATALYNKFGFICGNKSSASMIKD